mmetsp:Transcript_7082/g.8036  ORF Transcript_7082/g.8036 Transcript_7082/m.8036 type:complete len:121 (-) Transcript_7082:39-401(-)
MFLSRHLLKTKIPMALVSSNRAGFVVLTAHVDKKKLKEKKKENEEQLFSKQETETLKMLLKKMEAHAELAKKANEDHDDELPMRDKELIHTNRLKKLFQKHGVEENAEFMRELREWKQEK